MLQDYKVWRFLKSRGYKFIHFGDWWEPTRINKFADMNFNYDPLKLNAFSYELLKTTALYPAISAVFQLNNPRKRILYQFRELAKIPSIKGPKFVFAHLLIPHEPYVFDRNGRPLTDSEVEDRSDKENYLNQLIFVNKRIKWLVNEILSKSKRTPIIIIQSDEGPYISKELERLYAGKISWKDLSKEALKIHMRIFNAYYLPEFDKKLLYKSISPVNTFRLIFNFYFGTNFKLLKDESYIFKDSGNIYEFINITDKL
jgi:hypothetical protein